MRKRGTYALYKGESMLAMGTMFEIADEMGVKVGTIRYYHSRICRQRTNDATARRLVRI